MVRAVITTVSNNDISVLLLDIIGSSKIPFENESTTHIHVQDSYNIASNARPIKPILSEF
ncbi:hypothetical protein GPLA_1028 [Paraglaciecola polaris LMG 21857]|uniref:Uncharacterized protein n=1 Tax=Paraglaciecola polaris LMG 21857 TaxID=1129793 RepID=K6YGT2_9ALTE|nr:hypothetical protein GPLA_1028 [Paraglaciecola polaris LMG 21857]